MMVEMYAQSEPEPDAEFEVRFVEIEDFDPFAADSFVVGDLGTMSERLGPERAEAAERQSLTYYTRLNAARRLGPLALR